jgi:hypothetical protein
MSFRQGEYVFLPPSPYFLFCKLYPPTVTDSQILKTKIWFDLLGYSHTPVLTHAKLCVSGKTALRRFKRRNVSHLPPLIVRAVPKINNPEIRSR